MAGNPYDSLMGEAPPAASQNPYDAIIAEDRKAQLTASAMESEPHQPDQVAEAVKLGQTAGVPAGVALDNLDTLRTEQRQREMDALAERSPVLAKWLTKPENMGVAKDDVDGLSFFERSVRNLRDAVVPEGALKSGANIARAGAAGLRYGMPQAAFGLAAAGAETVGMLDTDAAMARAYGMDVKGQVAQQGEAFRKESTAIGEDAKAFKGDQTGVGFIERGLASGAESLGQQVVPTLASFLTGNPGPMLAMMGLQTTGTSYTQAREEGVDPLTSLVFAGGQGTVEVGTELLPALNLFKNLKMGSPIWKTILEQQIREQPGEQIATALQDFNEFVTLPSNHDKTVGDYLRARPEAAAQTFIATLFASSVQTGTLAGIDKVTDHLSTSAMKAEQAQQSAIRAKALLGHFTGMDAATDASKLRERSPEKFEEIAAETLKAQGRETAYLPVTEFETFYQSQNVDPAEAWQQLTGSPDGFAQAKATGADLQIPYAKYLARLSPEERKALTPHLRLSPDEMTAAEASDFGKNKDKLLAETQDAAGDVTHDAAYEHIYQDLLGQLMQRFPRDVADKYASAEASRFVAFNKAAGTDPLADYQANAPKIISEVPPTLRKAAYDVTLDPLIERLRTGNVPTEGQARGKSLLQFLREKGGLQDEGGELKVLDAEKADKALRKKGERRLVSKDGLTLDDAVRQARDAGYFPSDDPSAPDKLDINALLAAVDSELRGSPVYAQDADTGRAEGDRRVLNELGDFLAQSGIDLNATSNEEVKKFLQSGVAPQAMTAHDQTVLEQGSHPFAGFTREQFLGKPRITKNDNAAGLVPRALKELADVAAEPFAAGAGLTARYSDGAAAVYDVDKVVASYNFGDTLVVDKKYRRQGIAEELIYQWRMRNPDAPPAAQRTKAAQALQEKVWARIERERATTLYHLRQSAIPAWPELAAAAAEHKSGALTDRQMADRVDALIDDGRAPQYLTDHADDAAFIEAATEASQQVQRGGDGPTPINPDDFLRAAIGMPALAQAAADGSSPRAQIQFTKRGAAQREFRITLKAGTDLSSLLHELGHYWLERMVDVALTPEGSPQIKADVATLLKQYGDVTVEEWDALAEAKRTEIHESIARANEAYLFEGKAPSAKLRAVFARFRNWMLQVYGRISRLNVNLSPEVRAVFDRLYASQQEIEQARTTQFLKPLWLDRTEAGMTEAEWAAYTGAADAAKTQAEEELANEVMAPIRREEQDWWKAKRAAVTEEVTAQVNRRKDIVALAVLRTGKTPDGVEVDTPKLSKKGLIDDFGLTPESLAKLPRGIYSASDGLSADALAPTFGYASGKELIEALSVVPNKAALIKESVDAELKRRYPDIIDDGSIGDRAMAAVHNDRSGELLIRETQLLAERAGKASAGNAAALRAYQLTRQMAKAAAERVIENTPAKDIQPAKWRTAEAKAGNDAYRLARAGKLDEAAQAKRKQALNHFLYREAVKALEAIDKKVAHLRSLSTKGPREAIGKAGGNEYVVTYRDGTQEVLDSRKAAEEAVAAKDGFWFATNTYLEQIDRILERYDLRVRTNRTLKSRESLRQFVDKLNEDGIPHDIPDEVVSDARQVNYRELPYGFFTAVSDAVASIENVALRKSDLIIAGQKFDRDVAAEKIAGGIRGNIKNRLPSIGDPSLPEKMQDFGNDALSLYLNADYMTREMDGGQAGTVTDLVYRPLADAEVHAINRRVQAEKDLAEIFNAHYTPDELKALYRFTGKDAVPMPEIGETWSKSNVLAVALNWGNEGNRQALLRGQYAGGRRLTQAAIDRLLGLNGQAGLMTAQDWKFVQAMWKYIDSYWGEIKAKQQQRTGTSPSKVDGSPILTRFGQIEGSYYPLKFDSRQGGRGAVDEKTDLFQDLLTGRNSSAQTKRGHTAERIGSGGRPVKIDLGVAIGHITGVINDLELGDAVSAVYRLLEHRGVRQALTDAGKSAYHAQLKLWVKDVARGQTAAQDVASKAGRFIRTNFVKSVLTFKVATALLQQTGHVASLKVIGPKAWGKGMGQMLTRPWAGKNSLVAQIAELSPFMKSRWDSATANAGVYDVMRNAKGDSRPSWFVRSGYWAMLHSQMLVDAPTWMGAYLKAKGAEPANHKAAVNAADDAVKHAQGSGLFSDRSALERGTLSEDTRQAEWVKTWTTLLSYMMAKGRLAYETTRNTDFKDPLKVAQWTLSMVMLFAIESMIASIVRGGGPPDKDDDGLDLGDILSWGAKQAGLTALGTVPLLSLLGNELQGFRGGISITDAMHRIGTLEQQREQGEWDKAAARASSDVFGLLTGFPSGQADIALDAFWRAKEGEDVSPIEYLMRVQQ